MMKKGSAKDSSGTTVKPSPSGLGAKSTRPLKTGATEKDLAKKEQTKNNSAKKELTKKDSAKKELTKIESTKKKLAKKDGVAKETKKELTKKEISKKEISKKELTKKELDTKKLAKNELKKKEIARKEPRLAPLRPEKLKPSLAPLTPAKTGGRDASLNSSKLGQVPRGQGLKTPKSALKSPPISVPPNQEVELSPMVAESEAEPKTLEVASEVLASQIVATPVPTSSRPTDLVKTFSEDPVQALLTRLAISFQSPKLLDLALTHRSAATLLGVDNQRLEFLGDAVLGLGVSEIVFAEDSNLSEGRMSQLRAAVVNEKSLANLARQLGLGPCLKLGPGEEVSGGREKPSILADALEAIIGAYYLSNGSLAVNILIRQLWEPLIQKLKLEGALLGDFKTRLQELTQSQGRGVPRYELVQTSGPENNRVFTMAVSIPGEPVFTARGRTKKEAGQLAAQALLMELLKNER
jgi:ribonuclease-3